MKAEKIVLSFVAVLIGLIAAGGAFYIYQLTQIVPEENKKAIESLNPTPTPEDTNILVIQSPKDEEVFSKRLVTISGKTTPGAIIQISTEDSDEVIKPASNGNFTATQTIPQGTSIMYITAIFEDGREKQETRTVTFTTEEF